MLTLLCCFVPTCRQLLLLYLSLRLPPHLLFSTTGWVTHHAEANMPIVHATSRVCKFHTCPIILFPSLSSSSLPSLPFFLCLLSFHTCSPPFAHPHLAPNSLSSRKQCRLAKNMQQTPEGPAGRTLKASLCLVTPLSYLQTGEFAAITSTFMIRCMRGGV